MSEESPVSPLVEAFSKSVNAFGEAMKPIIEQIMEIVTRTSNAVHAAYIEHGAIYGDTPEGMLRWMNECSEIARYRAKAEQLEQYHEGLRIFRQQLAQRREEVLEEEESDQ